MSTSSKSPATIRQGGPGSSDQNAKAPLDIDKPPADSELRRRSEVSGGGGEADHHQGHLSDKKHG